MKPTKHVAILIETSRAYGRGLLRGVCRFYSENGSWSTYFKPHDLGETLPKWLKTWNGTGILARITTPKMGRDLQATGLPLIDLRGGGRSLGIPPFGPNNQAICELAFEHLHSLGIESFAFYGEPKGRHVYDDQREECYRNLVKENDFSYAVYKHRYHGQIAKSWEKEQEHLTGWLHKLPKPVGVMACHDDRGQQVLDACRRASLHVPDEVAVIGSDNSEFLCNLSIPTLSSIDVNSERIGYEAALLLDRMMVGEAQFNEPMYFDPMEVVVRQSTEVTACGDRDISTALSFIRQEACRGITVADVARRIPLSRSVLNRRFKKIVGRSLKEEILHMQLNMAKRLLINTNLPITAVSSNTGFCEARYFSTVFRRWTGSTPSGYRQQHGRHDGLAGLTRE